MSKPKTEYYLYTVKNNLAILTLKYIIADSIYLQFRFVNFKTDIFNIKYSEQDVLVFVFSFVKLK